MKLQAFFQYKMRSVNCFQTVACILFAVTVHGYVTNIHTTSSAWKKVDNSEHEHFNRHVELSINLKQ